MLHPLFSVVVRRPDIVAEHLAGYALLAREEAALASEQLVQRSVAYAVTAFSLAMGLMLAGVAAMLAAVHSQFHWALAVIPLVALAPALWGWNVARKPMPERIFGTLSNQFEADLQVLRNSEKSHEESQRGH
ncbi:hypothetical protein ACO2Q9_05235 [Variovorax sp. VNK109]|uniref:hypothetical protein n=1 Tax=Variovorax sp. VNK109 TaxID=3400919 RepID=UPI003BFEEA41